MIRKTLLLATGVLAALLIGAPLVLSFQMDNIQQAYVNALSDRPFLKVVHSSFARGWFSSRSRITLALDTAACASAACPRVRIDSRIYHGPLPFGAYAETGLSLKPVQGIAISHIRFVAPSGKSALSSPPPPITATTVVGLGGDKNIHVDWPAFKTDLHPGQTRLRVDSAAWNAHYVSDASATELRAALALPSLNIAGPQGATLSLHQLQAHAQRKLVSPSVTQFSLKLARLGLSGAAPGADAALQQLAFSARVDEDKPSGSGLMASHGSLSIARLRTPQQTLGPAILEYRVERLNTQVLERIRDRLRQLASARQAPGMAWLSLAQVYEDNAFALLHPGPAIDVPRLQVTMPSGDVDVTLHAAVAPMDKPGQAALTQVLKHLSATFSALAPQAVVEAVIRRALAPAGAAAASVPNAAVHTALKQLTAEHWLTPPRPGEPRYGFRMRLQDGNLQVNGQPAPAWSQFMQQLFNAAPSGLK